MGKKSQRITRGLLVLGALTFHSNMVLGQGYDPNRSTGTPLTIYSGSNVDTVDMSSGNLQIKIPLLHLPGRGLDTDILLTYNSKLWVTQTVSDSEISWYQTGIDTIWAGPYLGGWKMGPAPGWRLGVPRMGFWDGWTVCLDVNIYGACDPYVVYRKLYTRDGTTPMFGNENGHIPYGGQVTRYWSFDGTYMRSNTNDSYGTDFWVRYKDGSALKPFTGWVNQNESILKDTNGNFISCTQSSCVDSLGRAVNFAYANNLLQNVSYKDSSGTTQTITFTYQVYTLYYPWATQAPGGDCNSYFWWWCGMSDSYSASLLTRITLPNNLSYQFEYVLNGDGSTTGEVSKLILPTGGYVRYTYGWSQPSNDSNGNGVEERWRGETRVITSRIVSDDGTAGAEKTWAYTIGHVSNFVSSSTVTDPLGNQVKDYPRPGIPSSSRREWKNSVGTVVKTLTQTTAYDNTSYNDPNHYFPQSSNPRITTRSSILNDTNQQSKEEFVCGTHGNVTEKKEYDWGVGAPGTLLRRTTFSYLHNSNSAYAGTTVHILDRKTSESVYSPVGALMAHTLYEYDNTGIASTGGVPQHDYASHPYTYTLRGNLTKVKRWRNTDGAYLTATNTYNDVGNLLQTTDAGGHVTSFDYTDNFTDGISRNSRAFVTQVTLPMTNGVSHVQRSQYFFNSGLPAASCGENFPAASPCTNAYSPPQPDYTKYAYDLLNRLASTTQADGGQTTLTYNESTLPITVVSSTPIDATQNLVNTAIYDGLGRTKQTQQNSSPLCTVKVDITYDEVGRQKTLTNPYCSTSDPTYGITTYNYDSLGRTTSVVSPSGGSVTTSYSGNTATVTDQQGKKRKSETDALGRLIRVWEPDAAQNLVHVTRYQYDDLDNLLCVHQKSTDATPDKACTDATIPATWRPRRFTYNSLSQTTQAVNPESGTINYTYDIDSNLTTKMDARGITITYSPADSPIDALHRVTKKTYSDTTPPATFTYDVATDGLNIQYPVGRLVKAATSNTRTVQSYDEMGRVRDQWQCTPANCGTGWFSTTYQYNFASEITSQSNPVNFTLTHSYNAAAQLTQIFSSWNDPQHPSTLVTAIQYNAPGAITQMTYGNGLAETRAFNNRLQPTQVRGYDPGTSTDKLNMTYGFSDAGGMNNGNVMSWSATGLQSFSRTYTYDELNRLKTMAWTGGQCNYTWIYDAWGNRTAQDATGGSGPCGEHFPTVLPSNRIAELGYDAAGNVTSDGPTTFQYDAENRMISINGGGSNPTYLYDAHGRRVRKTISGVATDFIYDVEGNVISERQGTTWTKGYVYLEGHLLVQYDNVVNPASTFVAHKDHLGSMRLLTKVDKSLQGCEDYYPYGELIPCGTAATTTHKFTGKERDGESGQDYFGARYYGSTLGRFASPDILFVDQYKGDPQSWNLYAFVRGNPLRFVDLNGLECVTTDDGRKADDSKGKKCKDVEDDEKKKKPNIVVQERDPDALPTTAVIVLGDVGQRPILEFSGAVVGGGAALGASGGAACYYLCSSAGGAMVTLEIPAPTQVLARRGLRWVNAWEKHHWLVRQYRAFFRRAGLNPEDPNFIQMVRRVGHRLEGGMHPGLNRAWAEFIRANPSATAEDVLLELARLKVLFGG